MSFSRSRGVGQRMGGTGRKGDRLRPVGMSFSRSRGTSRKVEMDSTCWVELGEGFERESGGICGCFEVVCRGFCGGVC